MKTRWPLHYVKPRVGQTRHELRQEYVKAMRGTLTVAERDFERALRRFVRALGKSMRL